MIEKVPVDQFICDDHNRRDYKPDPPVRNDMPPHERQPTLVWAILLAGRAVSRVSCVVRSERLAGSARPRTVRG